MEFRIFKDPDDDNDGTTTIDECTDPTDCEDSDGDGFRITSIGRCGHRL
ncbi:MAG: hypothetical protein R3A47_05410 [Polyangiales bacterium]